MSKYRFVWPSLARIVAMVGLRAVHPTTATALPGKNNIDKNDLKKNVVKSKNIKPNAVTAKQIKDGTVGAAELVDPEAFHLVGTAGQPVFGTGGEGDCLWQNPAPATLPDVNPASFFKDADGIVHLAGVPQALDGPGGDGLCDDLLDLIIFQLPVGYQPDHFEILPSGNPTIQLNLIAPETGLTIGGQSFPPGTVLVNSIDGGQATTLDGITFRAATGPPAASSTAKKPPRLSLEDLTDLLG